MYFPSPSSPSFRIYKDSEERQDKDNITDIHPVESDLKKKAWMRVKHDNVSLISSYSRIPNDPGI